VFCVIFAGHVTVGDCVSSTVTANWHDAVLAEASVAVQVTVVGDPTGKKEPEGGAQTVVTPGQLSVAIGGRKVTTAPHWSGSLGTVASAGQVMTGGCVSMTVTVNEQVGPVVLVHVTVTVPTGKNEPEGGLQVTVPHVPVVVGAGYATTAPHWLGSLFCVIFAGQVSTQGGGVWALTSLPTNGRCVPRPFSPTARPAIVPARALTRCRRERR
jgi:hypothetical protein